MRSAVPYPDNWDLDRAIMDTGPHTSIWREINEHKWRLRWDRMKETLRWWVPLFKVTVLDPQR